MDILLSILSLLLITWWLIMRDFPSVLAPVLSTSIIRREVLIYGGFFLFLITMLFDITTRFADSAGVVGENITVVALLIVCLAAFLATYITNQISRFASVCYAALGAFAGLKIYMDRSIEWLYYLQFVLSWIAALILAMLLSALLYKLIVAVVSKSSAHVIKMTYYMRLILLFGAAGFMVAFGINNGALLVLINRIALHSAPDIWQVLLPAISLLSLFAVASRALNVNINRLADKEFDLNMQSVTAIIFSAAIVMILFSFKEIPGIIALKSTPLSAPSLLIAGLAGISLVSKREHIESETAAKSLLSVIITPLAALVISYLLFILLNIEVHSNGVAANMPYSTPNTKNLIFILITIATLTLIILLIINQQKKRSRREYISASRQQQLYENQKSLNEMEVKSVLAENRSLYNRLELKRNEMINVALNISEQKEFMEVVYSKLRHLHAIDDMEEKEREIGHIEQLLRNKMSFSSEIDTFYSQVELLHRDFGIRLTEKFPRLTEQERRLTTLLRLGFSSKHIATLMNIAPKSVEISRYRLRTKLGLDRGDNLIQFIKSI